MTPLDAPSSSPISWPADPVAAVVHADPYPYYASLLAAAPLVFEPRLKLWIAARADAVDAVLREPRLCVRPAQEPVPATIAAGSAGDVFSHLVRMNDGDSHAAPKLALQRALGSVDMARVDQGVMSVIANWPVPRSAKGLSAWASALPVSVLASLLGFPEAEWPRVTAWMSDFVACLSPLSNAAQIASAHAAAHQLMVSMKTLLDESAANPSSLVATVATEARSVGWDRADAILANLIGLMSQTHDATAGLIGNAIVALSLREPLRRELSTDAARIHAFIDEVARYDPSVQNTRRFAGGDADVCGVHLHAGDAVLVVLAAANRDPAVNPMPHDFLLDRPQRKVFTFGHARHQCPGQTLACRIAAMATRAVLGEPASVLDTPLAWRYRPSANGRIPAFIDPE